MNENTFYSNFDDFDDDDFNNEYEKKIQTKSNYVSDAHVDNYKINKINTSMTSKFCDLVYLGNSKNANFNKVCD